MFRHEMLVFALDPVNTSANSEELTAAKELLGVWLSSGSVPGPRLDRSCFEA